MVFEINFLFCWRGLGQGRHGAGHIEKWIGGSFKCKWNTQNAHEMVDDDRTVFDMTLCIVGMSQADKLLHSKGKSAVAVQRFILMPETFRDAADDARMWQDLVPEVQVDLVAGCGQQSHADGRGTIGRRQM